MSEPAPALIGVLIIDDDDIGRQWLRSLVQDHPVLHLLGEAPDLTGGRTLVESSRPDAIFLDIHLAGESGFDLLRDLRDPPKVVFVTCSPHHALQAIEWEAVDYLVKPVSPDRFAKTVQRLRRAFNSGVAGAPYTLNDRICLRSEGKTLLVSLGDIIALQADGNFTRVQLQDGSSPFIGRMLGEYQEVLPSPPFVRLDRSLLINLDRLIRVERPTRNTGWIWLRGAPQPLEAGRACLQRLNEILRQGPR